MNSSKNKLNSSKNKLNYKKSKFFKPMPNAHDGMSWIFQFISTFNLFLLLFIGFTVFLRYIYEFYCIFCIIYEYYLTNFYSTFYLPYLRRKKERKKKGFYFQLNIKLRVRNKKIFTVSPGLK